MDPVNVVNLDGFCLNIPGGNVASGQTLWTWDCTWADNQQFVFAEDSRQITAASDPAFCIDAGSRMGIGDMVFLSECNGLDQQKFGYDAADGSIHLAIPGLCLKAEGPAPVTVASCNNSDKTLNNGQHWKVQPVSANHKTDVAIIGSRSMDPVILVNMDGFCLDIPDGNVASGQTLWTWECNWEGNQQFIFAEDSWRITSASDPSQRFCIDAGSRMGIGDQVFLSECNGLDQQKFGYDAVDGSIYLVKMDGLCLKAEGAWNSATVTVASCTSPDSSLDDGQHWKVQPVSDQTHAEWI
jgi:hypothetical protein